MTVNEVVDLPDHWPAEVTARLNRLELRVDDLDRLFPLPDPPASVYSEEHEVPLVDWVAAFFATTFARALGGEYRWCPRWEEHPEAVFRLEALRKARIAPHLDAGLTDAVWLRDYLDPQLAVLLSSRGPFALCSQDRHELLPPLPTSRGD